MKRFAFAIALLGASPAAAVTTPTSPAALDDLAKVLEQSGPDAALDKQLLTLLREPAKTLDGITLPTTAAKYTATVDTALKLRPKGWLTGFSEEFPSAAGGVSCTAHLSLWVIDDQPGLRFETFAWGKGNCAAIMDAAIARAWAFRLRQAGRV
jgi:hypothetical protein